MERHKNSLIYICEDESIIAMDIKNCLLKNGFRSVKVFRTGKKLIEASAVDKPDIIILDMNLPGEVSGLDAVSSVDEGLPVIIISGEDEVKLNPYKDKLNICGFIPKPYDENLLIKRLLGITITDRSNLPPI